MNDLTQHQAARRPFTPPAGGQNINITASARTSGSGRFLKMSDVTRETSLHRATIYRRVARGEFPAPQPIGGGRVAWREADIESWKACPEAYTPT